MGKRINKKKYKNFEEVNCEETIETLPTINQSYIMIDKLNSVNFIERESITSILGSYDFSPTDDRKDQLLNKDLCRSLTDKLSDPFINIRNNSALAITNLIICLSECDIDSIFLFEVGLLNKIENVFYEYVHNSEVKLTEDDINKMNKFMKNLADLLILISELYDTSYNKLNFSVLVKYAVILILNPGSLSEDFTLSISLFITNILSQVNVPIDINYSDFAYKIVFEQSNSANKLIVSTFANSLFYIYCRSNDIIGVKRVIEFIYQNINMNIGKEIHDLNNLIQNFVNKINKEDMNVEEDGKETFNLKTKINYIEQIIKSVLLYLKTFSDIITNLDFSPEEEIIDDEEVEIIEEENNELEESIKKTLSIVFNENLDVIRKMLNKSFFSNLINFFCNMTIEQFLLNDFDKMVVIKQLLYDLEYNTLTLVNNIIFNFDGIMNNEFELLIYTYSTVSKRMQLEEYSKNEDFLSVLLTTLRNLLDKYPKLSESNEFEFKSLFLIFNNNINHTYIKINVIDIIAKVFSNQNHTIDVNLEICQLLYNMILNDDNIEVIAHILNAFYDIYAEDDFNINLIKVGLINAMKLGIDQFRLRIKNAYKSGELDKKAYGYVKDSMINLKRFIEYKEDMFYKQNLNI